MGSSSVFEKYYIKFLSKVADFSVLVSVRNAFILTLPLVMTGSLALLVNNFPITGYQDFMFQLFGNAWRSWGEYVFNGTFAVISVVIAFNIGYNMALQHNGRSPVRRISPQMASIVGFLSVMTVMFPRISPDGVFQWLGINGLFLTIVLSAVSVTIFIALYRMVNLKSNFFAEEEDFEIPDTITALIPAFLTVSVFAALRIVLHIYGVEDLYQFMYSFIQLPFREQGDGIFSAFLYVFVLQLLWCFGIHGANVLNPVTQDLYEAAMTQNAAAFAAGEPAVRVFTKTFFDVFIFTGGAGATVCLLVAILIFSRRNSTRKVGQISLVPAFFNINELLTFGLPIVLNPFFLIPFILCPIVLGVLSYAFTIAGVLPYTVVKVGWTTPPLINAFIATGGSVKAVFVQLLCITAGVILYTPFMRAYDRSKEENFKKNYNRLVSIGIKREGEYDSKQLLARNDEIGTAARALASDLMVAFDNHELYLEYQPQVNISEGKVFGVEALLRWKHRIYGMIPPQLLISIAEDSKIVNRLGTWIMDQALEKLALWRKLGTQDLRMAVNISVIQLTDPLLPEKIAALLKTHGVEPENFELEVTEAIALSRNKTPNETLQKIRALGVRVAVDDFGIGYSSLLYLRQFPVDMLKVGGLLSRELLTDADSAEIVPAVLELCRTLNVDMLVEYVENDGQLEKLRELGVVNFQGHLFSKALTANNVLRYIQKVNYSGFLFDETALLDQ